MKKEIKRKKYSSENNKIKNNKGCKKVEEMGRKKKETK